MWPKVSLSFVDNSQSNIFASYGRKQPLHLSSTQFYQRSDPECAMISLETISFELLSSVPDRRGRNTITIHVFLPSRFDLEL